MESEFFSVVFGNWQSREIFELQRTEIALQDLSVNLDEITELTDSTLFRFKKAESLPSPNETDLL